MSNIVMLVLCFVAGMLFRRHRLMPESAPAILNTFIIYISVPALALLYIHDIRLSKSMVLVILMAWLYFALAAGFFLLVGRYMGFSRSTTGALILTGGLGNTAFFGLPMIEAFYGHEGIATGILIDQTGSFLVLSTLGILVAGVYSDKRPTASSIAINILRFPPFIAMALAFALLPFEYPVWFSAVLKRLGDTLAPLALVSVGLQLRLGQLWGNCCSLIFGLGFKLLLAPMIFYLLYVQVLGAHGLQIQVTLFEAAMPPMISAAIVAREKGIDPDLSTLMVAIGLPLSFITLTGWWLFLRAV